MRVLSDPNYHFKAVNDNFGHLYGNEVLLHFSQLLENKFRHIDFIFRFGGEEFVVIVNRASINQAEHTLNRFRQEVELCFSSGQKGNR